MQTPKRQETGSLQVQQPQQETSQAEKGHISSMTAPPLVSCRCCKGHPTLPRHELGKSTEGFQGLCTSEPETSLFLEILDNLVGSPWSVKPLKL